MTEDRIEELPLSLLPEQTAMVGGVPVELDAVARAARTRRSAGRQSGRW